MGDEPKIVSIGLLKGHTGQVTQIATNPKDVNMLISSSRDKKLFVWNLQNLTEEVGGMPKKALHGHNHIVSDVVLSSDGQFALSSSWDCTLRLWDLNKGVSTRRFVDHTKDILSVAFSSDNRQIVSGSRDKTIKLWNTLGHCKYTITEDCHTDWVSCVRFSTSGKEPLIVSCGWDKTVKVWNLNNCKLRHTHSQHEGYLNTVTIAPDGSLCASGGKDGNASLWDLSAAKHLYTLGGSDPINALVFSPNRYWLCAATGSSIKIWDLEKKVIVDELRPTTFDKSKRGYEPECTCLAWDKDGINLFAGYTDGVIRVWQIQEKSGM